MNYENGNESDIFLKIMFFAQTVYLCSILSESCYLLYNNIIYVCIN